MPWGLSTPFCTSCHLVWACFGLAWPVLSPSRAIFVSRETFLSRCHLVLLSWPVSVTSSGISVMLDLSPSHSSTSIQPTMLGNQNQTSLLLQGFCSEMLVSTPEAHKGHCFSLMDGILKTDLGYRYITSFVEQGNTWYFRSARYGTRLTVPLYKGY